MVSCGRSGREKPYSLQNCLGFTNETSYLRAPCLKRVGYNRVLANQSPICAGPDTNSPDQLKESPNVCYTAAGTSSTRRHQAGEIVYQNIDCITKDLRDSGIKIDCTTGSCETGFTYTRADQTTIIVNSMEVNEQGNSIDDDDDVETRAAIAMSMQCIDDVSPTDQLKESPNVCYTAAGTSSTRRQPAGEIVYQNVDCITKDLRDSVIKIDCTTGSCETGFTYTRADQTTIIVNSMEVNEQGNNIDDDDDADTRAAIAMSMQCIDDVSPTDQLKESPNVCYTAAGTSSTRRQPAGEIVYQNVDCITKDLRDSVIKIDCTTGSCETGFTYTRADQTTIIVNSMEVNEQGNNIDDDDDADTRAAIAMSMQCIDDVSPTKDAAFDGASPMVKQLEPLGLNADNMHDNTARDWCEQKLIRVPNDTKKSTPALEEGTIHPGKAPELRDSGIIHGSVINTKVMDNDIEPIHNSITDTAVHMAIILSLQCGSKDNGASNTTAEQKTATLSAWTTTNTCDETSLMNRSPSYENKPFDSEYLSSDGLEQDTIYTMDPQQSLLTCVPVNIQRDYTDNTGAVPREQQPSSCMGWFFHRKKPDDVGPIYIQHPYATDSQILGDRFGAKLATYKWKKKGNIYYQHFLTYVTDKSPADEMKIKDWDELVLLNDSFVPNLNHEEVQRLFTNVKVDSHTRLTLIIRRITIPDRKHKEWLWYKTSAILVPELGNELNIREEFLEFISISRITGTAVAENIITFYKKGEWVFNTCVDSVMTVLRTCLERRKEDLDSMCRVWNAHQIRPTKNQNCPNGRPVVMYSVPSLYNTNSYLHGVEEQKIAACEEECRFRADTTCDEDIADLCCIYMTENDWQFPGLLADGIQVYKDLRTTIYRDLNMD